MNTRTTVTTDLTVTGMTCAACVNRVEKRLAKLDGVRATVNLATGVARVTHPEDIGPGDLVRQVEGAGYTATPVTEEPAPPATASGQDGELRRLAVTAALSLPVIVLSMVPAWQFTNWQWLCFALSAPVVVWSAHPFHAATLRGLRYSSASMDTLVSLGVTASFLWSAYALFLGGAGEPGMRMPFSFLPSASDGVAHIYLEAAVAVPLFVLLGRALESRAKAGTGAALRALADLAPARVTIRAADGSERTVTSDRLAVGDVFVVRPGERIAGDGVVVHGRSAVDASLMTGESKPTEVAPGSPVLGGAVNSGGLVRVRATAVGNETQLARIARLVADAQAGKARAQRVADQVAGGFVPAVLAIAVTVLGFWAGAGADPQAALTAAVAVLVVACPCALGLATPTALLAATGRGAQLGVLISGPRALEALRQVDTVVLDKTGTLTTGRMTVVRCVVREGGSGETEVLRWAAAAERPSEHPLGRALVSHVAGLRGSLPEAEEFTAVPGHGVTAQVEGHRVQVCAAAVAGGLPAELETAVSRAEAEALTPVVIVVDGVPQAVVGIGDVVRSGAYRAVDRLRRLGLRPVLATGDVAGTARAVAAELRIEEMHARCTPQDKARLVAGLRQRGRRVAVVGDGVNDTVALASADLGIAMGSGTDAAIGAADVTLVRRDLAALADAAALARRTLSTIRVNLVWAFAYNALMLPLAATGWLNPMVAAAAMSLSSLLVVLNSLRLRAWSPAPARDRRPGPRSIG
ncbi:cation-transporting P-type ATPase [Streptomyces xiamenensis]|uniref:Cation-transporting P-type ATPase B n=1 Tax=Streptomyces xiamenensis TaxID=408015 RepID=A0A0F7FZM1_9ACTN|nr:cation-transporting P-type ATPase [Streptomyces xiamenensis]